MEVYIKKINSIEGLPIFLPCTKDGEPIGRVKKTNVVSELDIPTEITCTFYVDGFFEERN